ncbi:uncharacterized protein N7459_001903 [Penicillium hispanicum]|uniref:uncharacterized protein n=1 Tax=Penicillium hispanicum TaxID=1080232 RepID=UPI00253FFEF1|nr:uncharacterized protein N7459_001903 [Penicillium hispanicum]KAJ5591534.1 hypothetical protein N7459_001903 [Penicillium hispanicum]
MKLSIFVPLTVFLSFTVAESTLPESLDDVDPSPCLVRTWCTCYPHNQCLSEGALVAGCASSVDYDCTCPSEAFKDAMQTCLEAACTDDDKKDAGELHKERCGTDPS